MQSQNQMTNLLKLLKIYDIRKFNYKSYSQNILLSKSSIFNLIKIFYYQYSLYMTYPRVLYAALTFWTYAIIHSVRTSFSYLKIYLKDKPLNFDTQFLGQLDMNILISLAISLKTFGWIGQRIGHKLFLHIGMGYLSIVVLIIAILQIVECTKHWVYILLYALAGISSCTSWPSCLSIVSMYYAPKQNGFKLSIWNGCSQFGDFMALALGYLLIDVKMYRPQMLLITTSILLILTIIANIFLLKLPEKQNTISQIHQQKKYSKSEQVLDGQNNNHMSPNQDMQLASKKKKKFMKIKISGHRPTTQVNFLNVWLLPSVTSYVLCYACLKAVNAIIMYWLYFYLNSIGINKYPKIITVSWSISIFIGSVFMGYHNNNTINKIALLFPLAFTALIFMYLGKQYSRNGDFHYLFLMTLSGLCFGGPYGLIGSTITLLLGRNPQIKQKKGAVGAIISLMEGFGQFAGAFFVLIVPIVGLSRLYYLPSILCLISGAILFIEHRKQINLDKKQLYKLRQRQLELERQQQS